VVCFVFGATPSEASELSSDLAVSASSEKSEETLTFTPSMRIQTRYSYNGKLDGKHDFEIRRLRLKGKGQVLGIAKYYSEVKIDGSANGTSPTPAVENAWVEFNQLPNVNLRIGLYDIPFSRNALTSDSKILFVDRSLVKLALASVGVADNTIGGLFHEVVMDGRLSYSFGIFDNNKLSGGLPTTAGRFTLHLLDPGKKAGSRGSYGSYRGSYVGTGRRLEIGANFAHTPNAVGGFDLYAVGGDVFFNSGPWTFQIEYDWYKKSYSGGVPDVETKVGYVQGAVLLNSLIASRGTAPWIPPIELAVRYQDIDAEDPMSFGFVQVGKGRTRAIDLGLNFYIRDHNLKVQTTYSWFHRKSFGDSHRAQLQLQLDF
jgi:phosphate-selective porin